jgi:hypothetical protein
MRCGTEARSRIKCVWRNRIPVQGSSEPWHENLYDVLAPRHAHRRQVGVRRKRDPSGEPTHLLRLERAAGRKLIAAPDDDRAGFDTDL